MYKIVLFVPEFVFIIFIFLPLFLVLSGYYLDDFTGTILSMVGILTGVFWMMGVSSYMDKAREKKEADWILIVLVLLFAFTAVNEVYQNFSGEALLFDTSWPFPLLSFFIDVIVAIWLTIKVKKVLYERSTWFVFFEIVCYGFGVATLTPEIKNHYRENKIKMDKAFADDEPDETILTP